MPVCPYCGAHPHAAIGQCPEIKVIEYYPDGAIKRVEKMTVVDKDKAVAMTRAFFDTRP